MDFEQLKVLKEKSDKLVETFQNDRILMQKVVDERKHENTENLREFLGSLREYTNLLPKESSGERICTFDLFKMFTRERCNFWSEDCWVVAHKGEIEFLCSDGDVQYSIYITKDSSILGYPEHHHVYSHIYFDDFKSFLLKHKSEIRNYVELVVEKAITDYVTKNKSINDSLYADVIKEAK